MTQQPRRYTAITAVLLGLALFATATPTATATPVAGSSAPATAAHASAVQESNSTEADTNYTANPALAGDDDLYIVDYWKEGGVMYVQLYALHASQVTLSAPPESDSGLAGGYVRQQAIPRRQLTVVSIQAPGSVVWLSSADSTRNGRFTRIDVAGPGLVPENLGGVHVAAGFAAGALMTAAAVLVDLIRYRYLEGRQGGERLDA